MDDPGPNETFEAMCERISIETESTFAHKYLSGKSRDTPAQLVANEWFDGDLDKGKGYMTWQRNYLHAERDKAWKAEIARAQQPQPAPNLDPGSWPRSVRDRFPTRKIGAAWREMISGLIDPSSRSVFAPLGQRDGYEFRYDLTENLETEEIEYDHDDPRKQTAECISNTVLCIIPEAACLKSDLPSSTPVVQIASRDASPVKSSRSRSPKKKNLSRQIGTLPVFGVSEIRRCISVSTIASFMKDTKVSLDEAITRLVSIIYDDQCNEIQAAVNRLDAFLQIGSVECRTKATDNFKAGDWIETRYQLVMNLRNDTPWIVWNPLVEGVIDWELQDPGTRASRLPPYTSNHEFSWARLQRVPVSLKDVNVLDKPTTMYDVLALTQDDHIDFVAPFYKPNFIITEPRWDPVLSLHFPQGVYSDEFLSEDETRAHRFMSAYNIDNFTPGLQVALKKAKSAMKSATSLAHLNGAAAALEAEAKAEAEAEAEAKAEAEAEVKAKAEAEAKAEIKRKLKMMKHRGITRSRSLDTGLSFSSSSGSDKFS